MFFTPNLHILMGLENGVGAAVPLFAGPEENRVLATCGAGHRVNGSVNVCVGLESPHLSSPVFRLSAQSGRLCREQTVSPRAHSHPDDCVSPPP